MRIKIVALFTLLIIVVGVKAQSLSPKIAFETLVYDFGVIEEKGGKVEARFDFTNIGAKPLTIQKVQPSCGCTTPKYSNAPIPPNGKGYIIAIFDPLHRPGVFNKTINVSSNASNKTMTLRIIGEVTHKKTIEEEYPYNWGDFRTKSIHFNFGTTRPKDVKSLKIPVINNASNTDIKLGFKNVPGHIKVKSTPETFKPGQAGVVTVTYDAAAKNDFDYVRDFFFVKLNGKSANEQRFIVSATIRPDYSNLSDAEKAVAPVATYPKTTFDFGVIKEGEKAETEFTLVNDGKSDLVIYKVKTSCGCTAANTGKKLLKPGEETNISARFDSRGRSGNVYKTITVVTNAPNNPSKVLIVKGKIAE